MRKTEKVIDARYNLPKASILGGKLSPSIGQSLHHSDAPPLH